MRYLVLTLLILASICFAIIGEEQARELFAHALESWYAGDVVAARESMSQALSGLIYITDIPEFWFFTAKLDIDTGNVARALEDLRTLLVLAPTKDEAISLVKEIETFTSPMAPSTPTLSSEILKIEGFKNSVEYFYSPVSVTTLGRTVCIADRANYRLIVYGPAGYAVHKLSFRPESIISSAFKYLYIAGEDKLALFDMENNRVETLASNLLKPVLAGFDRLGRLWGADVDRLFCVEDGRIRFFELDEFYSIQDVEVGLKGIWVLDIFKNRIVLFDFSMNKVLELPAHGAWSFELTVFEEPFILKDDALFLVRKDGLVELGKFQQAFVTMEYSYPFLFLMDFKGHSVHVVAFKGKEPILVKIDSLSFDQDSLVLSVRVENIFADPIPVLGDMYQVREGGGPVFSELSLSHRKAVWLNADRDFFKKTLPTLKRGSSYAVFVKDVSQLRRDTVVSLRGKNVRIFVEGEATEEVLLSGGFGHFKSSFELLQPVWNVRFMRTRPTPSDIVPVKFEIRLAGEVFSDTVYYTRGMIPK
ncbi:MAG: Uncharacterized protein XD58_1478 [Thermotoga sp. 50_1627]|uniref:hypothetical protein n=1 Tax=Pseudothermotoga sp. TaxID=2033661 RepID=UPI00076C5267|nr:MAG: Uncharacterized protein XD45_1301 [Thermotoga sp. 50_64]KUK24514.1 MAG: Uncharacterized protein XD58_1478 [Thermotoga sp. 50_1627]MBC7117277.1 hypothetical protein [Pseudothermotoga sp.]MDK2923263.1 hypothetical protein [Pseudothermotoga sp.]HBT39228.1 hypothetical protein [Pseudothermotoga sp.]